MPAIVGFDIYQNNVRTDSLDAVPGDYKVIFSAADAPKPAGAGNDDCQHMAGGNFDFHIGNESKPPPVGNANDLLAVQLRDSCTHSRTSRMDFGTAYAGGPGDMTKKEPSGFRRVLGVQLFPLPAEAPAVKETDHNDINGQTGCKGQTQHPAQAA